MSGGLVVLAEEIQDLHAVKTERRLFVEDVRDRSAFRACRMVLVRSSLAVPRGFVGRADALVALNGALPHAGRADLIVGLLIAIKGNVEVKPIDGWRQWPVPGPR